MADTSDPEAGVENLAGRGAFWNVDQALDQPIGEEAGRVHGMGGAQVVPLLVTLRLAFQSLGVVYGDLGTSPLYVFRSIFSNGINPEDPVEDILGALSLVFYTVTLIPVIKYVFIVLRASDLGEGGTFALYSLICRHVNISSLPNKHPSDEKLTTYVKKELPPSSLGYKLRRKLEESKFWQNMLLVLVLLGTCMVIGDGILTPAISVLSAVDGIRTENNNLSQDMVVLLAIGILVVLFAMQRSGTTKVAFLFAPVVLVWFVSIGAVGIYNVVRHDASVFRALSPHYLIKYFQRNKHRGWASLGGVVLSITGTEALFADLGHFTDTSIRIAFMTLVFPCLMFAYFGQAAYLLEHPEDVHKTFYKSLPDPLYWPIFVVATFAAIIGSQAIISATFSIVKQSVALSCFPRVKIIHTSRELLGRVYIPEVNWILMGLSIIVVAGFRDTTQIGNAYGIAVVAVFLVTTCLTALIMVVVWQKHVLLALGFLLFFGFIESVYLSAVLSKAAQGGWVPIVISAALMTVMYSWHYGSLKRYEFEMQNKVSVGYIASLGPSLGLVRVPGIGLVYTELAHGVPSIFSHFITNLPAMHSTLIFVCIKYLPVATVIDRERFLFRRIGPKEYCMFRCAVRYGYTDVHKKDDDFEEVLMKSLESHLRQEALGSYLLQSEEDSLQSRTLGAIWAAHLESARQEGSPEIASIGHRSIASEAELSTYSSHDADAVLEEELAFLARGKEAGLVHLLGNTSVRARRDSGLMNRLLIDGCYSFLRRICRDSSVTLKIPHENLLQVGMVYYV